MDAASGPDNQTKALLCATYVAGALAGIGSEVRLLMARGAVWRPASLLLAYVVASWIVYRFLRDRHRSGLSLCFGRQKRRFALRQPDDEIGGVVRRIAAEMGLKAKLSVGVVPNTWSVCDAFACGGAAAPRIVLTSGATLLGHRTDQDSMTQFRFLIRHETAHLLAADPQTIARVLALMIVSAATLLLKLAAIPFLGVAVIARWYEPLLPRSFAWRAEANLLVQLPISPWITVRGAVTINLLLLAVLFVVTWSVIRRREYWADHAALQNVPDGAALCQGMRSLFSGPRLRASLPHAARGWLWWHPSPQARLWSAQRKLSSRAWYSWTGALVSIPALFLVRYVWGNNTGYASELPATDFVTALSYGYFIATFFIVYWLVYPSAEATRLRMLLSAGALAGITILVTAAVAWGDEGWTLAHSIQRLPQNFIVNIQAEIDERAYMVIGIGAAVLTVAATVLAAKLIFQRCPAELLAGFSAVLLWLLSSVGANLVGGTRAEMVAPVRLADTLGDSRTRGDACDDQRRGTGSLAAGIARLQQGRAEFSPPFDSFMLERGPAGAFTTFDERSVGLIASDRENILKWYAQNSARHPELAVGEYRLLEAYGQIVRGNASRHLGSLENLTRGGKPTAEQQAFLNIGLRACVERGTFPCLRLALALGADPRAKPDERNSGKMGPLEAALRSGITTKFVDECTQFRLALLLQAGADPNEDFVFPWIVQQHEIGLVRILLKAGANPGRIDAYGNSALLAAFESRDPLQDASAILPVLKLLLSAKPDPNGQNSWGETALMQAAASGSAEAVSILLAAGADPAIRDRKGYTAADYALGREIGLELSELPARRRITGLLRRRPKRP